MSRYCVLFCGFFFFQAEDGIRDLYVTGVQTCALPISGARFALLVVGIALDRAAVLVDVLDGFRGNAAGRGDVTLQTPRLSRSLAANRRRHTAIFQHAGHAAHGVGPAAEAEQIDAVTRLPHADDLGVAVD